MARRAQIQEWIRDYAPDYGFDIVQKNFDWQQLIKVQEAYIERVHGAYERVLDHNNITRVTGFGTFVSANTIAVDGEHYSADHILIAAGAQPTFPDIPGAELGISSDGFFALQTQPKRVAVVGAGYIAVELAGVLQGLGSETHLCLRHAQPLRQFDEMLGATLLNHLQTSGVTCHTHTEIRALQKTAAGAIEVQTTQGNTFEVDCLIWAIGRTPATTQLGLAQAGVKTDTEGYIEVDAQQNTNIPGIYAVGDNANHGVQLTPAAVKAGRQLSMRLFAGQADAKVDYQLIPTVIFSHPPIGTIGMSEAKARETFGDDAIKVYTSRFTAMLSAVTSHRQDTDLKLICQGDDEQVVGMHGIGFAMDEILQGFAVAIKMGATKADFDSVMAIHPTSAEEWVTLR